MRNFSDVFGGGASSSCPLRCDVGAATRFDGLDAAAGYAPNDDDDGEDDDDDDDHDDDDDDENNDDDDAVADDCGHASSPLPSETHPLLLPISIHFPFVIPSTIPSPQAIT